MQYYYITAQEIYLQNPMKFNKISMIYLLLIVHLTHHHIHQAIIINQPHQYYQHDDSSVKCSNDELLIDGECRCPINQFKNTQSGICQCHPHLNPLRCQPCPQLKIYNSHTQLCQQCPKNTIFNPLTYNCDILNRILAVSCGDTCITIGLGIFGSSCQSSSVEVICSIGCQECQCISLTSTRCIAPHNGYYMSNQQLKLCPIGCKKCSQSNSNVICSQCFDRYILIGNSCSPCKNKCTACNITNTCTNCQQSYFFTKGPQVCSQCVGPKNCIKCNSIDNSKCQECSDGYYISQGGLSCMECPTNCGYCSQNNITQCIGCSIGYYLTNNTCQHCAIGCKVCSSPTQCTQCLDGYSLSNGICNKICYFPCLTCSNGNTCKSCYGGYTLTSTSTCQPNVCTNCSICPQQYYLDQSKCVACGNNCAQCTSSTCLSCMIGYYYDNNTCISCGSGCQYCLGVNICLYCLDGYTFIIRSSNLAGSDVLRGVCIKCESPCLTCVGRSNRCLSCIDNYTLNGWKCLSNYNITFNITLDINLATYLANSTHLQFIKQLRNKLQINNNPQYITIKSISSGSTIILGEIATPSQQCTLYKLLAATFKEGQIISNIRILSAVIKPSFNSSSCPAAANNVGGPSQTLRIILGMVIGVPIGLLSFICGLTTAGKLAHSQPHHQAIHEQQKHETQKMSISPQNNNNNQKYNQFHIS